MWLLKTEPSTYSFDDLLRDGTTIWDGVANATAQKHMRSMHKGESLLIYHTGDVRAIVGTATIAADPQPDKNADNKKLVAVKIKAGKQLKRAVTLDQIKADPAFEGWDLLRIGRLSVVPTSAAMMKRVDALSRGQ